MSQPYWELEAVSAAGMLFLPNPIERRWQMEGGMGAKRWEEGRRGDNKQGEWREMREQGRGTV